MNSQNSEYEPYTIFAYRPENENWIIDINQLAPSEIKEEIKRKIDKDIEFRLITKGLIKASLDDGRKEKLFNSSVFEHGWRYDRNTETWRAPDEPLSEPMGDPTHVNNFEIIINSGLDSILPLTINAGEINIQMTWSYVYNPLPRLLKWLERIVQGIPARILINEEGRFHEITGYIRENDNIRLVIDYYERKSKNQLDIVIPCKIVVSQIHKLLNNLNEKSEFLELWSRFLPEKILSFKSQIVENYLERQDNN